MLLSFEFLGESHHWVDCFLDVDSKSHLGFIFAFVCIILHIVFEYLLNRDVPNDKKLF
jgi:hypothetical protein